VLVADPAVHTLLDARYRQRFKAGRGAHGGGNNRTGGTGSSVDVRVPVGTLVVDVGTGETIADLVEAGQRHVVVSGGAGGVGNAHFARATHQAPEEATEGEPGVERRIRMDLKLLADVGVVGLPNAGKSTLIARVSNARPRIADYPFTTLVPNLGVVERGFAEPFIIADIPGLIEGAHEGLGLGHRFLRHIERTAVLLFLLDHDEEAGRDALTAFSTLREELRQYDPGLAERPAMVVLNKADLPDVQGVADVVAAEARKAGLEFHLVSAVTGDGVEDLLRALGLMVEASR